MVAMLRLYGESIPRHRSQHVDRVRVGASTVPKSLASISDLFPRRAAGVRLQQCAGVLVQFHNSHPVP
jgi:hypothetical protein